MVERLLDPKVDGQRHAGERLAAERVIWLGTVAAAGHPHSVPVWFAWDDPAITVFSRPDTAKVAHLRERDGVSVALDTAGGGTDVVLGHGRARLIDPGGDAVDAFAVKYAGLFGDQGFDGWRATFSLAIVVTVTRLVVWRAGPDGLEHHSLPA